MPVIYSKKYNYTITWCPKSGCSLIRNLFLQLHKNECKKELTNSYHSIHKDFPYNGENIKHRMILVRNPYKRVVSMFTNKYMGLQNKLYDKINLKKDSFYEFVLFLYNNKENLVKVKDGHILKQSIQDKKDCKIIKLENLNEELLNFYKKIDNNLYLKVKKFLNNSQTIHLRNKTRRDNTTEYIYNKEFETNKLLSWPDYKYFYNDEIKEMVYEIYKDDFENFNYNKDFI